jgi:hypothetical protein
VSYIKNAGLAAIGHRVDPGRCNNGDRRERGRGQWDAQMKTKPRREVRERKGREGEETAQRDGRDEARQTDKEDANADAGRDRIVEDERRWRLIVEEEK